MATGFDGHAIGHATAAGFATEIVQRLIVEVEEDRVTILIAGAGDDALTERLETDDVRIVRHYRRALAAMIRLARRNTPVITRTKPRHLPSPDRVSCPRCQGREPRCARCWFCDASGLVSPARHAAYDPADEE